MLFNNCIGKEDAAVWKAAASDLEFERITFFSEDDISYLTFSQDEIEKRQNS